jgi:hypothetical protein
MAARTGGEGAPTCLEAWKRIRETHECERKKVTFETYRDDCWGDGGAAEEPNGVWRFNDSLFEVADCFRQAGRRDSAADLYRWGLAQADWAWDEHEGFMAHTVLKARIESLNRNWPKCGTIDEFRRAIKDFAASRDLDTLDTWVDPDFEVGFYPGSAAPSPYSPNRAVISRWAPASHLKVIFEENGCFLVDGWEGAPYRTYALCAHYRERLTGEGGRCATWGGFHAVEQSRADKSDKG